MAEKRIERRKYRRVNTRVQVSVQKYNAEIDDFYTDESISKNLSAGGILLHNDKPVDIPSFIIASFIIPDSEDKLDFVGKAVRIEELPDNTYEIGVMFMRMILGEFDKLEQYVAKELNG